MDNTKSVEKSHEQVQLHSLTRNAEKGNSTKQKLSFADNRSVTQRQRDMMGVIQRAHHNPEMSRDSELSPHTVVNWHTAIIANTEVGISMDAYLAVDHVQGAQPEKNELTPLFLQLPRTKTKPADRRYIRGHLLNDNLGGPGKRFNLFPITHDANMKHENDIENIVKGWVNDEKQYVHYTVNVFPGNLDQDESGNKFINSRFFCVAELLDSVFHTPINTISAECYSTYGAKTPSKLNDSSYDSRKLSSKTHEMLDPVLSYGKDSFKHLHGCTLSSMQPGMAPLMQLGITPSMQPGMTPLMQPGMAPLMQPGMAPLMQPGMTPFMQPKITPSMQPGMAPLMQLGITPSMQPGMTPLMQSIEGISHEQLNLCNATLITTYFQQIKDAMELNGIYKLFAKPIDPIIDNCIDYHKVIKRPMDMDTIYKNMTTGYYNTVGDMIDDINTCLTNYKTYHPANDPYISSIDKILALPFLARKLRQVGS